MAKYFVALIISVLGSVVLGFLAGMSDGMCHCMNSMYSLFPYGTTVEMRTSYEFLGMVLTFVQFPLYTIVVMLLKGAQLRVIGSILIAVVHILAAVVALNYFAH